MDVSKRLKDSHPQKYYFKIMCRLLYYMGLGDCWYEKLEESTFRKRSYMAWAIVSNAYMLLIIFDELLAFSRPDLTNKEKRDLIQFTLAHPTVYAKIIALYFSKARITVALQRLLEGTRPIFSSILLERACVRRFAIYCFAIFGGSYVTLFTTTVDRIRAHFKEDIPIRIEVTFYPASKTGLFFNILRFFIEFHWWYMVAIMVTIDCLALCSLLSLGRKFKLLQMYFNNLRTQFLENVDRKSQNALEEDFKKDFVIGIQLHEDALCCARHVQQALGNLYSIQVVESVALIVMCLLKMVVSERELMYLLANCGFIGCLILLTGCYMMAGGDITHEASLVSTAMFHCGWELVSGHRGLRQLLVVALQRGQEPVYMTAFGIMTLSYSNFISVLRSSYSFFTVMY